MASSPGSMALVVLVQGICSSSGGDEELLPGLLSVPDRLMSCLPSLTVPLLSKWFGGQFSATLMGSGVLGRADGDDEDVGLPLGLHQGHELLGRRLLRDEEGGGVDGVAASRLSDNFSFLLGDPRRAQMLSSFGTACLAKSKLSLIFVS